MVSAPQIERDTEFSNKITDTTAVQLQLQHIQLKSVQTAQAVIFHRSKPFGLTSTESSRLGEVRVSDVHVKIWRGTYG